MGLLDFFSRRKDPDVVAAEKRAYEEEAKVVRTEKKNAAIRTAVQKGKERARSGSSLGASAKKIGRGIINLGEQGSRLNWEFDVSEGMAPSVTQPKSKNKKKGKKVQQQASPFEMPEFPF